MGAAQVKICRFKTRYESGAPARLGLLIDESVRDVTPVAEELPALRWPVPPGDQLIAALPELTARMDALARAAPPLALSELHLLAPVANPGKFVCGAGNWKHHGAPLGLLGFMFKASSALAGPDDGVQLRWPDRETLHEPELAIVIGRTCSNVPENEALAYVAGYTCALDMTLKQEREDFAFCKSFDSYGMLGPWLVTADEISDPSALSYNFWVNDELRGSRSFGDLTGNPAQMIAFASSAMTLYPGDVILTGAADVAPVAPGDLLRLEIPRIGRLVTRVAVSPEARNAAPPR
jgi:2,4-didehydro-3-deoxy-L-rhamnonate hydrolase